MKYELTSNTITHEGRTLYQIRATRNFGIIKAGKLGGYVEHEDNLSQDGNCWIDGNAKVYDNAMVTDNAWIDRDACVYDYAVVKHNARVTDSASVYGESAVADRAIVGGSAKVYNSAIVSGNSSINGNVNVFGCSHVGNAIISGSVIITGDVLINSYEFISGDAYIDDYADYILFNIPRVSRHLYRQVVWTRSNNMWSACNKCFTSKQFAAMDEEYAAIVEYVEGVKLRMNKCE